MQVQANSSAITSMQTTSGSRIAENLQKPASDVSAAPAETKQREPSQKEVETATKKLQGFVDTVRNDIQFSMDQDSGRSVVKVIDKQTKDVLMQFPSEEALGIAKSLDRLQGLLIKQKA